MKMHEHDQDIIKQEAPALYVSDYVAIAALLTVIIGVIAYAF